MDGHSLLTVVNASKATANGPHLLRVLRLLPQRFELMDKLTHPLPAAFCVCLNPIPEEGALLA